MRRTLTAATALALTGCVAPAPPVASSPPTRATTRVSAPAPASPKPVDPVAWVKSNYQGAAWLPVVVSAQMHGDQVWVDTLLRPGDTAGARPVCSAFSAYLIQHGGFTGVRVAAGTGERITWRRSVQDPC